MKKNVCFLIAVICLFCLTGIQAETIFVDNSHDSFSASGSWSSGSFPGYMVTDYMYSTTDATETTSATWSLDFESSGTFEIFAWYVEGVNRVDDAKFTVTHKNGTESVYVDQTTSGSEWVSLGSWDFEETGGGVTLSNESATAGNAVIADAIKAERTGTSYGDLYQGMWVYSWGTGFLSPSQTDQMIATARANNVNCIFPEVRKVGDAYYDSATEPRASNIDSSYSDPDDPLQDIIDKAHDTSGGKQYIEVHAWIVPYRVWKDSLGSPPANHVLSEHPEWEGQTESGASPDGYLDPGVPEVTDYLVDVAAEIVENYDVDGIHWDYFRYPGSDWGYNPTSVARFNALYGKSGPPSSSDPDFCDFRRDQIRHMGRKVYAAIKNIDWNCKVSAATIQWGGFGGDFTATSPYNSIFQDWPRCMEEGVLDMNVLMNYKREHNTSQASDYRDWATFLAESKDGRHAVNGPGVYMNSIHNSVTQSYYGIDVDDMDGTNFYVYHLTNKDGDSADDFWHTMRNTVYSERKDTPTASWLETPTHGILRGTVYDGSGPIDGATVTLSNGVTGSCKTDGTGFYAFLEVPVGTTFTVTASAPGWPDRSKNFDITAGSVTTIDFDVTVPVELSTFGLE